MYRVRVISMEGGETMSYLNSINNSFMNFNYPYSQNQSNNVFNMSSLFGDYASIKSGSYGKLLKAYYSATDDETSNKLSSIIKGKESSENIALKEDADSLQKSSADLYTRGSKSLFNKKEIKTTDSETGEVTISKDYDREAILNGVKSFVSDYNKLIDTASSSKSNNVLRKALYMTNQTKTYSYTLDQAGITIGKDNKLTIDETKFKEANMDNIKDLFNGSNSLSSRVGRAASDIGLQLLRDNTYSQRGTYNMNNYYNNSLNMYL